MESISLKNISKRFTIQKELKEDSNIILKKSTVEEFFALRDINLTIKKGETFGFIGRNGCGKTTLLKIIAGILEPTSGKVIIDGKLMSFIELGVGLQGDLSGRDNIYLYGSLLGIPKSTIEKKMDWIIEFSGLHDFIDAKFRTYSSGMQIRLAFSIAMMQNPDILLIDEILAVGDTSFHEKSFNKIKALKEKKKTIILVSHDLHQVRRICDRVAFIDDGKIVQVGEPKTIIQRYLEKTIASDKESISVSIQEKKKKIDRLNKEFEKKIKEKPKRSSSFFDIFGKDKEEQKLLLLEEEIEDNLLNLLETLENYKKLLSIEIDEIENQNTEHDKKKVLSTITLLEDIKSVVRQQLKYDKFTTEKHLKIEELIGLTHKESSLVASIEDFDKHIGIYDDWVNLLQKQMIDSSSQTKNINALNELLTIAFYYTKLKNFKEKKIRLSGISDIIVEYKKHIINKEFYSKICSDFINIVDSLYYKTDTEIEENAIKAIINSFQEKISEHKIKTRGKGPFDKSVKIEGIRLFDSKNKETDTFHCEDTMIIRISYKASRRINKPCFGIGIFDHKNNSIFGPNTTTSGYNIDFIAGTGMIECSMPNIPLLEGRFLISASITSYDGKEIFDYKDKNISFNMIKGDKREKYGFLHLPHKWEMKR